MKKPKLFLTIALIFTAIALAVHPVSADDPEDVSGRTSVAKMTMSELRDLYGGIPGVSTMYLIDPIVSGSDYRPSVLTDEAYATALGYINYYRICAGLTPVSFTNTLNTSAGYGALTMTMGQEFSHTPSKPADMSDADYQIGYNATSSSNISWYGTSGTASANTVIRSAVSGQMEDSDSGNISRVGHRRWLLDPRTQTMGFGTADVVASYHEYYTAIRVFGSDVSTTAVSDYDFISWPASGNNLTDTFPVATPWSVTLNPSRYKTPSLSTVNVTLTRLSDGTSWSLYNGTADGYFTIDTSGIGISNAIIFRPNYSSIGYYVGSYQVDVSGIKDSSGNDAALSYTVTFAPYNGDLNSCNISLEYDSCRFKGNAVEPEVTVICKNTELEKNTDYTVTYSDNAAIGTATATITGIGSYYGTVTKTFEILPDRDMLTFNANGGTSAPETVQCDENGQVVIPTTIPTRRFYSFQGWALEQNAQTAQYQPGETITLDGDLVLYAVWDEPAIIGDDGTTFSVDISTPGASQYFEFDADNECTYKFTITGRAYLKVYYKSSGSLAKSVYTTNTSGMIYNLTMPAGAYYIETYYVNTQTTGSYTISITHKEKTIHAEVPATCTEPGTTEWAECTQCGKVLQASEELPALGHDYVGSVTKQPSCIETGVMTYTCSHDSSHTYTETIPMTAHTPEVVPAVPASCTQTGLTEGSRCAVCGEILEAQEEISALGHDWDEGTVTTPATCTGTGVRTFGCNRCDATREEQISATGHDWGEWVVTTPATEEETGVETRTCTNDPSHTETREIPKLEHQHSMSHVVYAAATCTGDGHIEYWTCSGCGKFFADEDGEEELDAEDIVIPAAGHTPGQTVREAEVAATCSSEGSYQAVIYCAICHAELSRENMTVSKLPHTPEVIPAVAPTATETGLTEGSRCSVCGTILVEQQIVPATGYSDVDCLGHTVTLDESISLNFYFSIPNDLLADTGAKVVFTKNGETVSELPIHGAQHVTKDGVSGYMFSCETVTKEMADTITATIVDSGNQVCGSFAYSVKQYCEDLIALREGDPDSADLVALVKALLNYGAAAQSQFSYHTDNMANSSLSAADRIIPSVPAGALDDHETSNNIGGAFAGDISYYGLTLDLLADLNMKLYFQLPSGGAIDDYTFTITDNADNSFELETGVGRYGPYARVSNIYSVDIDAEYIVNIYQNGEQVGWVKTSPFAYAGSSLNSSSISDELRTLLCAMYYYNVSADAYFN